MSKRIKANRYKPNAKAYESVRPESGFGVDFCLKCIMTVVAISLVSLASIFVYDFITQSSYFHVKEIQIYGTDRASKEDLLKLGHLEKGMNLFEINVYALEKKIITHPWVRSVTIKRDLPAGLIITVVEQQPLAIVKIENLADILINIQGQPFKEYNPQTDQIRNLPVISGLDLTSRNNEYLFNGPLFNSIMNFLDMPGSRQVTQIKGDRNTGLLIETADIYNTEPVSGEKLLQIKLGFDNFHAKLSQAKKISQYMVKQFPDRQICAMDLSNLNKAFIKTKRKDTLHNTLEKGV